MTRNLDGYDLDELLGADAAIRAAYYRGYFRRSKDDAKMQYRVRLLPVVDLPQISDADWQKRALA